MQTTAKKLTVEEITALNDEVRDIMLQLREEQLRHHARLESVLRQLAKHTGDKPKSRPIAPWTSPYHKPQDRKTNRK